MLHQAIAQPERVEYFQRSRLDGERARFVRAIERAINDPEPPSQPLKLGREREASRPCTDDEHRHV
jgi:hypothetical protein